MMPEKTRTTALVIPHQRIAQRIYRIRAQKVMLDEDLAELYGVPTKRLNGASHSEHQSLP